jgi:Uma2 family endonuclease
MEHLPNRPLTAEEYARLPEGDGPDELVAGFVVWEPHPLPRHARIQVELASRLHAYSRSRELGVVLTECGFLLATDPDTVRGPDVAFVAVDRYDANEEAKGFFRGAPDLAVEILSPSNSAGEIHAKVADYLAAGSKVVWVIDPERRRASAYRTLLAPRMIPADGVLDGEDVVPGFRVTVSDLLDF